MDLEDIQTLERRGIKVYAPPKERYKTVTWKSGTKPELMAWRERMETDEGKAIYRHPPQAGCRMRQRSGKGQIWGTAVQGQRTVEGDLRGIAGGHHP